MLKNIQRHHQRLNLIYHQPSQMMVATYQDEQGHCHTLVSPYGSTEEYEITNHSATKQYNIAYTNNSSSYIYTTAYKPPIDEHDESDTLSLLRYNIYNPSVEETVLVNTFDLVSKEHAFYAEDIVDLEGDEFISILGVHLVGNGYRPRTLVRLNLKTLMVEHVQRVFPIFYDVDRKSEEDNL